MQYFLSVDAGTTSFKAALYNENWERVAWSSENYQLLTPMQDVIEYPVEGYWQIFCAVVKKALAASGVAAKDIAGIAIDSQGETLIALDGEGQPLHHAIVWLDNRSKAEAEELEKCFGAEKIYAVTGQPESVPTWPATKILWLKRNKPEVYSRAAKYLMLEDYLLYRLTGKYVCEKSLYPSTMYADIAAGTYWWDMLDVLGVKEHQLPQMLDSGVMFGSVTKEAAEASQLMEGTPVVTGALDQTAAMVGAGNVFEGVISETTGTALAACATVDGLKFPDQKLGLTVQTHAIPGMYFWLMWAPSAGLALEWFKNQFYKDADVKNIFDLINQEAISAPAASDGLVFLPYLCGAGTPEYDPHAKGVFYGIDTRHTRGHFSRAIMESIGYMLNRDMELLKEAGLKVEEIRSLGGGAKSPLWNQIKADITRIRIANVSDPETTNLGAAIIAAAGVGKYSSIAEGSRSAAKVIASYQPNEANFASYASSYGVYKQAYTSLKDLFSRT